MLCVCEWHVKKKTGACAYRSFCLIKYFKMTFDPSRQIVLSTSLILVHSFKWFLSIFHPAVVFWHMPGYINHIQGSHLQTHGSSTHKHLPPISFPHPPHFLPWPWSIDSAGYLAHRSPWESPRWADLLPFCGRITVVQWDLVWKLICNWEYWRCLALCHVPDCPFLLTHKTFCFSLYVKFLIQFIAPPKSLWLAVFHCVQYKYVHLRKRNETQILFTSV